MKYNIKSLLIVLLLFLCIFLVINNNKNRDQLENNTINSNNINAVQIKDTILKVDVAYTREQHAKGLSGRESLSPDSGMLFVFNNSGQYLFWMKDMNFPIDIIWVDENYKIVFIEKNAKPESYPSLFGGKVDSKYVIETVSGFSDKNKLQVGDQVSLLSI